MKQETLLKIKYYAIKLLITTFAVVFSGILLRKGIHIEEPRLLTGLIVAGVLILLNVFLKPVMVALTIPFSIASFGFFLLIINACIILLIDALLKQFTVDTFWWALWFSILVSITSSILESIGNVKITHHHQKRKGQDDEFTDYEEV